MKKRRSGRFASTMVYARRPRPVYARHYSVVIRWWYQTFVRKRKRRVCKFFSFNVNSTEYVASLHIHSLQQVNAPAPPRR